MFGEIKLYIYNTDRQEISGQYLDSEDLMCPVMQYCDVITNPRWRTTANLKITKSPYLSEKLSDFDEISCSTVAVEPDDSHVTKN